MVIYLLQFRCSLAFYRLASNFSGHIFVCVSAACRITFHRISFLITFDVIEMCVVCINIRGSGGERERIYYFRVDIRAKICILNNDKYQFGHQIEISRNFIFYFSTISNDADDWIICARSETNSVFHLSLECSFEWFLFSLNEKKSLNRKFVISKFCNPLHFQIKMYLTNMYWWLFYY